MASERIESDDVFGDIYGQVIKDGTVFLGLLKEQTKALVSILSVKDKLIKANKLESAEDVQKQVNNIKDVEAAYIELNATRKTTKKVIDEIAAAEAKLTKAESDEAKQKAIVTLQILEQNKANKEQARQTLGLIGAYEKQSKRLDALRKQYKDLVLTQGQGAKGSKELLKEITTLDAQLKNIDASTGQFNRQVGNYKNSIKEAFAETNLFNTGLGRLLISLKNTGVATAQAAKETGKASSSFKALGVGLAGVGIGLGITALNTLKASSQGVADTFDEVGEKVKAGFLAFITPGASVSDAIDKVDALYVAIRASRTEFRALAVDINVARDAAEDFARVSNDTTIGIDERNAALDNSITKQGELLKLEEKQAILQKQLADDRVNAEAAQVGLANVGIDFLDKQNQAAINLFNASDALNDFQEIAAAQRRARAIEETELSVNLLLKQKLSAKELQTVLAKQIEDQKRQVEDRIKLSDKLLKAQNQTTAEEIKIIKEKTGLEFDEFEFLNEANEINLADKLKSIEYTKGENQGHKIGSELINLLAKVTKTYQDNKIANDEKIAKLTEEQIERDQKVLEINRKIALDNQQSDINSKELDQADRLKVQEDTFNKLLASDALFNAKKRRLLKLQVDAEIEAENEIFDAKSNLLRKQAENEIEGIKRSVFDEQVKAAEITRINNKLNNDLNELSNQKVSSDADFNKKIEEQDRQLFNKEIDNITAVSNAFFDALAARESARIEQTDREIERAQTALDTQQRLAEKGLDNTLAFEQKRAAELERRREDEAKKQRQNAEIVAFFNLFAEYAKDQPDQALAKSALQIAAAKTLAGLLSAYDGTEDTGGPGTIDEKGGKLAILHPHERVVPRRINEMMGGISNDELGQLVVKYKNGEPQGVAVNPVATLEVITELRELRKAVQQNTTNINFTEQGEAITTEIENGMIKTVKHLNRRPRI